MAPHGDDGRTVEFDGGFHPPPSSSSSSSWPTQTNNRCQIVSEQRVVSEQRLLSVSSSSSGCAQFTLFVWKKTDAFVCCCCCLLDAALA